MWIRLTSIQYIALNGKQEARYPGDWVNVGKQTALLWQSRGDAEIPQATIYKHLTVGGSGILVRGDIETARARLYGYQAGLALQDGDLRLPFKYTIIYSPSAPLRHDLLPIGLSFLDTWQLAVPMWDYEQLALSAGTDADRQRTEAVIRDLRVPLYDTRLIFARQCPDTERLITLWRKELADGGDERLAFLRALYAVKPLILALPMTWTRPKA